MSTLAYRDQSVSTANATSWSFASQAIGPAEPTRLVIVGIVSRNDTASVAITISTVTIGGISASKVVGFHNEIAGAGNGAMTAEIWAAAVPTGTTATVVVTNNGNTALNCGIGVWTIDNPKTTAAAVTSGNGGSGSASGNLNLVSGDMAVGIMANGRTADSTFTWTGLNEDFDTAVETGNITYSGAHFTASASETPRSISCAPSGASTISCLASAAWTNKPLTYPNLERGTRGMLRGMPGRIAA